jgi:cell division protein FtsI/penicillin-binding protein 2
MCPRICDPGAVRRMGVVAVVVACALGALAFVALRGDDGQDRDRARIPDATPVASDYLAAWNNGNYRAMTRLVYQPPAGFAEQHQAMLDVLRVGRTRFVVGDVEAGPDDTRAVATFTARLQLRGLGRWQYRGRVRLVRIVETANGTRSPATPGEPGGQWRVAWGPSTLHPEMRTGLAFARSRTAQQRGAILDANGQVLVGAGDVVQIGVEPRRIQNRDELARVLQAQLGVTRQELDAGIARAQPDWFVPLRSLPRGGRFDAVWAVVGPVPGVVRKDGATERLRPDDVFARHVLGTTHEITAEELEELGAPYDVGDVVGSGGVEETYERQLAGTPAGDVHLVDTESDKTVAVLKRFRGKAPRNVTTTLDPGIQAAADAAVAAVSQPAALVAVDTTTGEVRAVASRPLEGFNRALTGRYPPGSTFKIITATAALSTGATPGTTISCPGALEVGGRTFHNFEGEAAGSLDFATAFAESCNNAFIQLAQQAGAEALDTAAKRFGFTAQYNAGLPSFGGSFPAPSDDVELAAASIGQGRVEASPLHMASVAATAATGTWRPPVIVRGVANDARVEPVPPAVLPTLQSFMAGVVRRGTGQAAAVAGRDVFGKTGTAEFGNTDPAPTHAWFVGYSGNIAFAVLVEGGGVGGRVAAPIAGDFLQRLP